MIRHLFPVPVSAALFFAVPLLSVFSQTDRIPSGFGEYRLQNGMQVFICEDFSAAPVRIEYAARAGISAQTPETAGFLPLYSRLFLDAGRNVPQPAGSSWLLSDGEASCGADSARYIITAAPAQTEQILDELARCAFSPLFTDAALQTAFSALKTEVMNYAFSTAGFVNSSIDARVFSDAPWKQDSGIYPSIFTNMPLSQARVILAETARKYYTPRNSALFISGGIPKETALRLAEKTFGSWPAGVFPEPQRAAAPVQAHRKFVLHDPLFSSDLTQIVVQYTALSMTQADIAAAVFNARSSSFKKELLSRRELGIRGDDYISAAAAHKNGISRLIMQSLLENTKTSPVQEAAAFLETAERAADTAPSSEYDAARQNLAVSFSAETGTSAAFMDKLSQFWAVDGYRGDEADSASPAERMVRRPGDITSADIRALSAAYDSEEPFVFVLVNSTVYSRYEKAFAAAGYESVTQKNGSWYTQKLYEAAVRSGTQTDRQTEQPETPAADEALFASRNSAQFSSATLANGIPVIFKQNPASSSCLIMISIRGGQLSTASNPGFFQLLVNALAGNIQREISERRSEGSIDGTPAVRAETGLADGIITVESLASDMNVIIPCISRALIYGDIKPAQADGLIYDQRSRKRLHDGDASNQLYSRAVLELYGGTPYTVIFDSDRDILEHTSYSDILASYPSLLDASRYTLAVTGNFSRDDIGDALSQTFGLLSCQTDRNAYTPAAASPVFPKSRKVSVKLRHLFLTDVSAEDAGPRPAVLVPTKNFSDPVQYWLPSPDPSSPDFAVFNALMFVLRSRIEKALAVDPSFDGAGVKLIPADSGMHAAAITLTGIEHTKKADAVYASAVRSLAAECTDDASCASLTGEMKSSWILNMLSGTQTNRGTALLIREGLVRNVSDSIEKNAAQYISDYTVVASLHADEVKKDVSAWLAETPPLRLYSADSKR